MDEIKINIDGQDVAGFEDQTILEIARRNGIEIPTLCHDERVEIYGACGLCTVEIEGSPKLFRACSTFAAAGMVIKTHTERIEKNRRAVLELQMSDHAGDCIAPCILACPAQTNCQGYVKLVAEGKYAKALELIKEKIPLPASIGRICPHPCEEACRRELVEEPIAICAIKQFAGDLNLEYIPEIADPTGKKVAVIGGGPGGLSAAYFLKLHGHEVSVYDAMPKMGGMLEYGVPEYRLPKNILQKEIKSIESMGVTFCNNVKIGHDVTLDCLRKEYDAVIIAIGAWSSANLGCPGEELEGVLSAVDFLRDIDKIDKYDFGNKKIAVVGGGDIAMDACRTAVRLGAGEMHNIYRRTKNEMPANKIEIAEAEEEGVIFKNLANPLEIIGYGSKVKAIRLQLMELGEADASGRRSPIPMPGKEETIEADVIIIAIGQKPDSFGFEEIEHAKWGTISADEHTFQTNLDGVFAIGDATNKGADIAVTAIGEAKKAAEMVSGYLNGEQLKYEAPYLAKTEKKPEDFADKEKLPRVKMRRRKASERKKDFAEVNATMTQNEAKREASRCLECGCHAYKDCKLIKYANRYKVQPEKYKGEVNRYSHTQALIDHNPEKCILCGLCVRICEEVVGMGILGFVNRGFETGIKPVFDADLCDFDCKTCQKCIEVCPTGALGTSPSSS